MRPGKIILTLATTAALTSGTSGQESARTWPNRTMTMVVAFAPGGPLDGLARNLQPYLGEALGQQVIIENVAGGGGTIGSLRVANADHDSHMILLGSVGTHAISQSMYTTPPYNALTDFAPVILVADAPQVLLARKDFPASNLREFAAYAKTHHDRMQHGSGGAGTSSHVGCVLVNQAMGVKVTHVPYRGAAAAMQDLLAGRIDYICNYISTALVAHRAHTAKVISALGHKRTSLLPEVPAADEEVLPASTSRPGTPCSCRAHWRAGAAAQCGDQQGTGQSGAESAAGDIGLDVPAPERRTPAYLAEFVSAEIKRWREPVLASGVQHN